MSEAEPSTEFANPPSCNIEQSILLDILFMGNMYPNQVITGSCMRAMFKRSGRTGAIRKADVYLLRFTTRFLNSCWFFEVTGILKQIKLFAEMKLITLVVIAATRMKLYFPTRGMVGSVDIVDRRESTAGIGGQIRAPVLLAATMAVDRS